MQIRSESMYLVYLALEYSKTNKASKWTELHFWDKARSRKIKSAHNATAHTFYIYLSYVDKCTHTHYCTQICTYVQSRVNPSWI